MNWIGLGCLPGLATFLLLAVKCFGDDPPAAAPATVRRSGTGESYWL